MPNVAPGGTVDGLAEEVGMAVVPGAIAVHARYAHFIPV